MPSDIAQDYALYLRKSIGRKAVPRQRVITAGHVASLGGRIAAEFADADRTAFRKPDGEQPVRDEFTRMLAMLAATPGLGVAAWHADRLTRNDEDTAALIRVCSAGGHLVITPSGGTYDLSTANGRRRLRDDASAAIYEVDHGRERVLAARAEVAAEGRWLGGKRPFGWEPEPEPVRDGEPWLDEDGEPKKGVLRLVRAEADALARACQVIIGGGSLHGVAREWNGRGVLTSEGKQWTAREAGRVLRRPRNAGLMEHNGSVVPGASWPAVVDEPTWRAVVAILDGPGRKTTPGPASRHLLSWIARCGTCGGPLICTSTNRPAGTRRLIYRCREDARGHVSRDAGYLEEYVTEAVLTWLGRDDTARILVRPDDGQKAELGRLHAEKAAVEALMVQRDKLHRQRVITDQMLIDGLAELRAELDEIGRKISQAENAGILAPLIGDPPGVWAGMTLDQRRTVIARVARITVLPAPKGRPAGWRPGEPYSVPSPETVAIEWRY